MTTPFPDPPEPVARHPTAPAPAPAIVWGPHEVVDRLTGSVVLAEEQLTTSFDVPHEPRLESLTPHGESELRALLSLLPEDYAASLINAPRDVLLALTDISLDLGRSPRITTYIGGKTTSGALHSRLVTPSDLTKVVGGLSFSADRRSGMDGTLHKITAMTNRSGGVVGLTLRACRSHPSSLDLVSDLVMGLATQRISLAVLGGSMSGKTSLLRELSRAAAEHHRVVIVDSLHEIAGASDTTHPSVGLARRIMVPEFSSQAEAIEEGSLNHAPEVLVVDELGSESHAHALRRASDRGAAIFAGLGCGSLWAAAHSPIAQTLLGVSPSEQGPRLAGTPIFDMAILLLSPFRCIVFTNLKKSISDILGGRQTTVVYRWIEPSGRVISRAGPFP